MQKLFFILISAAAISACSNDNSTSTQKGTDTVSVNPSRGTADEQATQKMDPAAPDAKIEVQPIQVEGGWGYDVMMNGKRYVHQPHIPAVSGNRAFSSEADARKAGELVAYKIRNNIMPPGISLEELDSIGVLKK